LAELRPKDAIRRNEGIGAMGAWKDKPLRQRKFHHGTNFMSPEANLRASLQMRY
jgi:hypothetical protein